MKLDVYKTDGLGQYCHPQIEYFPLLPSQSCNNVIICDRLWENRPLRALLQNRVIGIQGECRLKAIICGIFFVMEVMRCGALAVSIQSLLAYRFKTKSRKL